MPPKPKPEVLAQFEKLKNTLAISGVQKWNTALYEILVRLIDLVTQSQNVVDSGGIILDDPSALQGDGTQKNPLSVRVDGITVVINEDNNLESSASGTPADELIPLHVPIPATKCRKSIGFAQDPAGGATALNGGLNGARSFSGTFTQQNDTGVGTGGVCSHWARSSQVAGNVNDSFLTITAGVFWETKPFGAVRFRTGTLLNGNDALGAPAHNTQKIYWFGLGSAGAPARNPIHTVPHVMILCNAPDKLNAGSPGLLEISRLVSGAQVKTSLTTSFLANTHYVMAFKATSATTTEVTVQDKTNGTEESMVVTHDSYFSTVVAGTANDIFNIVFMASGPSSVAGTSTCDWGSLYFESD